MTTTKPARTKRKRSGKWSIAPPPSWRLDVFKILLETDGELGVALLLAHSKVRLFSEAPPNIRNELFGRRTVITEIEHVPEELREAIHSFGQLARTPAKITERNLAHACRLVAEWAEDRSRSVTAIVFAEAAAHLLPDNAEMANLAGRACRRAGDRPRAELWYERGWGLARRAGNTEEYVNAHLGFGGLLRDFKEYGRALKWVKRAGLSARRKGLKESGAEAIHDAYILAYLAEDLARACVLARKAATIYPVHARRVPYFGADLALLLSRHGLYLEALELLELVRRHLTAPVDQIQLWAFTAFAAGGAQQRETFDLALQNIVASADLFPTAGGAAFAYAAAGAQLLRAWESAETLIEEAWLRTESDPLARELADRVRREIAIRSPGVPRPPREDPATATLRSMFPEVASRLRRWRGPTWRPPRK